MQEIAASSHVRGAVDDDGHVLRRAAAPHPLLYEDEVRFLSALHTHRPYACCWFAVRFLVACILLFGC